MAKKKKPKPFRAVSAVKAAAREAIGQPPPVRRESASKPKQKEKHKATLGKLLGEIE